MKEIFSALAKAQRNFEPALKKSTNPLFRSSYAALDVVVDAVREPLNEQNIFLSQSVVCCEAGVTVETIFCHASGESFSAGKVFIPIMLDKEKRKTAHAQMSALTYAKRASLCAACGIAPQDDDGNGATVDYISVISKAPDFESLKSHFAAAYSMADAAEKLSIKAAYDTRKLQLTTKEPA